MAMAPAKPCLRCRKRTRNDGGYCDACQERRSKKKKSIIGRNPSNRQKTTARGYGAEWRKVRDQVLEEANWLCQCAECRSLGRLKVASVGHHIKSVETHPHLRLVKKNILAVNWFCHEKIHGRGRGGQNQKFQKTR